ncbi:MAG TPA: phosphate uptake regulator PhoU [Candidatus Deferrimicrobium sp.]|nr:phosphate uptake regulator PhoU [Candidatus Deferrimicrobium sp.]
MEVKKVQEVKGSYYIYLPKAWCKQYVVNEASGTPKNSLKEIQLKRNEDDSLLILPRDRQTSDTLQLSLQLDSSSNEESVLNSILAGYIVGIDRIELVTKTKLSLELRDKIFQLMKQCIGFEITEETSNKIIMQEVSTTVELDGMMRQLLSKVGLVLTYVADIIKTTNVKDAHLVISQDDETDKFRYSIERQVHQILRQPNLARKLKISAIECHHFSQCMKYIERIADHCVSIASLIVEQKKPSSVLLQLYQKVRDLYVQMKNDFYPVDVEANYNVINEHYKIITELEELEQVNNEDSFFTIHLKRICSYCSDIAEVRINSFVYKKAYGLNHTI